MDNNDEVVKKTELVINGLSYAQDHNLDIHNKDDVKKILEVIDPEHVSDEIVADFMKLLLSADALIEIDVDRRSKVN